MKKTYLSLMFFCCYMFMSSQDINNIEVYKNINSNYTKSVSANNDEISYYEEKLATLEKTKSDLKELSDNIDFIRKSNNLAPKDEFETTEQFNSRIEAYKEREIKIEEKVEKIYIPQMDSIKRLLKNEKAPFYKRALREHLEIKEQLNTISEFLTINPVRVFDNIGITSLDYDADKEMFTLESSQFASKYEIKVALNNAKEFKENIDNVKFVIAYQRIIGVVVGNNINSNVTQLSYGKDFLCNNAVLFLGENAVCNIESEGKPLRFTAPFAGSSMDGFSKNVATNLDAINTEVNSNRRINVRVLFKKSGQIDYLILSDNLSDKKLDYIHEQLYSVFTKYEFVPAKNKASIYQDIYETIEVSL